MSGWGVSAEATPWVQPFSAETYSSLGYGDVIPGGALRLLAGVDVLNGLLLSGWSASCTYISMERFWSDAGGTQ